jgi:glucose/arabinose dehydrogenase
MRRPVPAAEASPLRSLRLRTTFAAALALAACATTPGSPDPFVGFGPNPPPPKPQTSLIPTIGIPEVVGWPAGGAPRAPPGFTVTRFAEGLDHPRWLHVLPNGDVLVAQSAGVPSKDNRMNKGVRGFFAKMLMRKAGAATPSPNKIVLLRDADGDGRAETRTDFATGLTQPFGMALVGDTLYVANADGVVSLPYRTGQTAAAAAPAKVFDLPSHINHHWTKNVAADPAGTKLYATVGSNSNIGDNGLENEEGRAAIWEYDLATRQKRLFATGLRNPNGLAWEPSTGALWTTVNERDELGADLVPDYMTSVRDGGFYGWPWSYFGGNVDRRVKPARPDMVAKAISPDYGLGPHTASLGLAFYTAGAFVGQHGSWNRKPLNGYRVVFVPFANGRPQMPAQAFLTGFLSPQDQIYGRPVGVEVDRRGALLVADDVGNIVWRVAPAS